MGRDSSEVKEAAIRGKISGRVQGVFFRETTKRRALELGLRGWVRNQDDGSVLVHAEGPKEAVDQMVSFLGEGPPAAEVEEAAIRPAKVEGHEQFAVRGIPAGDFAVWEYGGSERGSRYALGLEVDGLMRIWDLPKRPSTDPSVKRLAIELNPGAETGSAGGAPRLGEGESASVWDGGPYEQGGRVPWPEAIDDRGHAVFVLHGDELKGGFALQRTAPGKWLLIKRRD